MGWQVKNFETLKKEADFNLVIKKGKRIKSTSGYVKATYLFVDDGERKKVKTAIKVPSKCGNKVWRNRFKRLIRESIKSEIKTLSRIVLRKNATLLIIYSPMKINQKSDRKLKLDNILPDVNYITKIISETDN